MITSDNSNKLSLIISCSKGNKSCAVVRTFPSYQPGSGRCGFAAPVFGLRPNTCRPAADETKLPDAGEKKPLVPRVCHIEVEFVVGSLSCCERFFSGYSSKTNISKFQFDQDRTDTIKRVLKNS